MVNAEVALVFCIVALGTVSGRRVRIGSVHASSSGNSEAIDECTHAVHRYFHGGDWNGTEKRCYSRCGWRCEDMSILWPGVAFKDGGKGIKDAHCKNKVVPSLRIRTPCVAAISEPAVSMRREAKLKVRREARLNGGYKTVRRCSCRGSICANGKSFFEDIPNAARVRLLRDYKLKRIYSAPAHTRLRDPAKVKAIANGLKKHGGLTAKQRTGWKSNKLWVDVTVKQNKGGHLSVCHVELRDGHHRMVGALMSGVWKTLGNIGPDLLKVSVNGDWPSDRQTSVPTNDISWPRLVPIEVGEEARSNCPHFRFHEVHTEHGINAQLPKDFTSISLCLSDHKGVPLEEVSKETKRRLK
eukprot:TRINITY_DN4112_c0_g1_i2.p1 TRINITY_DN4112_c0_g1~~TRINITY_DN4112_c0_g1_i2.p1  ORF type:complete len:379 (+),score=14.22 TRINITY_DN4112_c0_g1_i2:75-1139(+)